MEKLDVVIMGCLAIGFRTETMSNTDRLRALEGFLHIPCQSYWMDDGQTAYFINMCVLRAFSILRVLCEICDSSRFSHCGKSLGDPAEFHAGVL